MMILPLADALQNCMQNLTSRIAGVDNEQMTSHAMGMGAMLGYSIGTIKEQFNTPNKNVNSSSSNNSNSSGGLQGFIGRAKSIINPSMNLSSETDYDGNSNPIRSVIPKDKLNTTVSIPTTNGKNKDNISNGFNNTPKTTINKVAKTGFNMAKTYVGIGARMAEGDLYKSSYKNTFQNNRKNNFKNTEYINTVSDKATIQKLGDENEPKEYS